MSRRGSRNQHPSSGPRDGGNITGDTPCHIRRSRDEQSAYNTSISNRTNTTNRWGTTRYVGERTRGRRFDPTNPNSMFIQELILRNPGIIVDEICRLSGINKKDTLDLIRELDKEGVIN